MLSDFFWKKLNYFAGLMAIMVLFGLLSFAANLEIKDLDLWLHVKTGKYIVTHHEIPNHDVLSCSIPGKPWVNHEWLFQVILYLVAQTFGFDSLITLQVVVVGLIFLVLLFIAYRTNRQALSVFCLLMVLLVFQSRFTIRPDIFSLLFFAIDMWVLSLHINKRWSIWVLAIVQLLWVNMHGFFIFGPILVMLGLLAELLRRLVPLPYEWNKTGRLNDEEFKRLAVIFPVLILTCLINPYFIAGAIYPIKVLFQPSVESKIFFEHIYELQRPFKDGWAAGDIHYKILIIISGLSFLFNRRKIDISVFFLWLIFLLFSLAAIRNLVFFSCAAYLVILVNSMDLSFEDIVPFRFNEQRFKELTEIILKVILIAWMLNYMMGLSKRGYFDFDIFEYKSEYGGVSKRAYATQAVDFLVDNQVKGNFFNDFNSGAYLIGRTSPNIKVFIDGRTEVYGSDFFKAYLKVWKEGNKKIFADFVSRYHLTGAFLNGANQQVPMDVIRLFHGLKDWRLVYFDYDGMIYLKDTLQNKAVIDRYAIDLKKWHSKPMDLKRLASRRVPTFQYVNRARMLLAVKLVDPAIKELKTAQLIDPDAYEIYQYLGDAYKYQKKYTMAFENFRIAVMMRPGDNHLRLRLAWAYEHIHDKKDALVQYERMLEDSPDDVKIINKINDLRTSLKKKVK